MLSQSLMLAAMLAALPTATAFGRSIAAASWPWPTPKATPRVMTPPKTEFFRGILTQPGPTSSAGQGATPRAREPKALSRGVPPVRTAVPMSPKRKLELGIALSKQEETIYLAQLKKPDGVLYSAAQPLVIMLVPSIIALLVAIPVLEAKYLAQTDAFEAQLEIARQDARLQADERLVQYGYKIEHPHASARSKTRGVALMSEASVDHDEEGKTRTAQRFGDEWKRRKRLGAVNEKLQACACQIGYRAKWVYCRFLMSLDAPSADERRERRTLLLEAEATRRSYLRLEAECDSLEERCWSEAPGSAAQLACAEACYQADLRSKAELQGANALLRQFLERCSRSYFSEAEILARREAFARLPAGTIAGLETQFLPTRGNDERLAEGAVMPISISSTAAPMTLAEQVQIFKSQLGLKGSSMAEVVRQAAVQLGVEAGGRPLVEVAASCMQVLGVPEREGSG